MMKTESEYKRALLNLESQGYELKALKKMIKQIKFEREELAGLFLR